MKPNTPLRSCLVAAGLLAATGFAYGQATVITWTAAAGDLFAAANWDRNAIPGESDIILIDNAGVATIAAGTGTAALAGIRLGEIQDSATSGHVIMNGGTLTISGTSGDPKAVIGGSANLSTFIMNGGTILHDGPDQFPGSRSDDGLNGLDWEVGEKGMGRFEMHGDAVFRAGDDLKVGANAAGGGSVLIDGNARFSAGSGISVSEGGPSAEQLMIVAGNALVEAGNSMGAGDPLGSTDEGYLTMASGNSTGRLVVQDNAVINYRRLSAREGTSTIVVKDRGQMHIFDVLVGKGYINATTPPDRPAETGPNSTLCSQAPSEGTITLQDDAQMTVNSDPASGPTKGLGISAPRDSGNTGGKASLIVRDRASFRVEQNLEVGTGSADTSDGTLTVIGPAAKVSIGGNLNLAVDLEGTITPGKGTLNPVITAATHATVDVAGIAKLANGTLKVSLSGYAPVGGESYTLIKGGTIEGQFLATDFTGAPLGAGLAWAVEYTASTVLLKVTKSSTQEWKLVAITGQQGNDESDGKGGFLYPDHTLFEVNPASGALTKLFQLVFANDSQSIGFNPVNGLLYHTSGSESYSNNPLRNGHDQGGPDIAGVGYQDSQFMETVDLTTRTAKGVFNAAPCPNPDPELPCFGLPAPRPAWVRPEIQRDSTQTDGSFRERGENEYHAARGMAWSAAKNLFYVSDENGLFKLTPGGESTFLAQPAFGDGKSDVAKGIAFVTVTNVTKLLVGHRDSGALIEVNPETGEVLGELALTYPPGGGEPADGFGGVLGLAQHPVTGVLYGIRKTGDNFARELVTINAVTGATALVGSMGMHVADIVFTTTAAAPVTPTVSVKLEGADIVITYTGALHAADTVNGAYSPVAGASPLRLPVGSAAGAKFYRSSN